MSTIHPDNLGFLNFGGLDIDQHFDFEGRLCFLCGRDGEAYLCKDEVIKLRDHLSYLITKYEGVVTADA